MSFNKIEFYIRSFEMLLILHSDSRSDIFYIIKENDKVNGNNELKWNIAQ